MPVYFIRKKDKQGLIKIGQSIDPQKRLVQIQNMSPEPLEILKVFDNGDEEAIHHHFRHLRMHGEWFEATPGLLEFIDNPIDLPDRSQSSLKIIRSPEFQRINDYLEVVTDPQHSMVTVCWNCNRVFLVTEKDKAFPLLVTVRKATYCPFCGVSRHVRTELGR